MAQDIEERLAVETKLRDDALALLNDPNVLNRILNESGNFCSGEYNTRKAITLICFGAWCDNAEPTSTNILITGKSGTGKDRSSKAVLGCFGLTKDPPILQTVWHCDKCDAEFERQQKFVRPPKKCDSCDKKSDKDEPSINLVRVKNAPLIEYASRITPTALNYWHANDHWWDWNGKLLYLEDIEENVLNAPVMKTLLSGGNRAIIPNSRTHSTDVLEVKGKPVVIVTSANSEPSLEAQRRFTAVSPTETAEQTIAIMDFQADKATGEKKEKRYADYVVWALTRELKRMSVVIPFANTIPKHFPSNIMQRTNHNRFLDLIKFATVMHQYQRRIDSEGRLIATKQDYEIAREVFDSLSAEKSTLVPLTRKRRALLEHLRSKKDEYLSANDLASVSGFSSKDKIYSALDYLGDCGLVEIGTKESNKREVTAWKATTKGIDSVLPDFEVLTQNRGKEEKEKKEEKEGNEGKKGKEEERRSIMNDSSQTKQDSLIPQNPLNTQIPLFTSSPALRTFSNSGNTTQPDASIAAKAGDQLSVVSINVLGEWFEKKGRNVDIPIAEIEATFNGCCFDKALNFLKQSRAIMEYKQGVFRLV